MTVLSQTKTASNVSLNPNLLDYETSLTTLASKFTGSSATKAITNNPDGEEGQVLEISPDGVQTWSHATLNPANLIGNYPVTAGNVITLSAEVYVPESVGLTSDYAHGLKVGFRYQISAGTNQFSYGSKATKTGEWERLTHTFTVPTDTTLLHVRLMNGFQNTSKKVYYRNIKLEYGSTATTFNPGESGPTLTHTPWTNTSNATICDTNNTSVDITASSFSRYLHAQNFQFNIPQSSIIHGIEVKIKASTLTADKTLISHAFLGNNYTPIADISKSTTYIPTTPTEMTLGTPTDTWGAILTPSIINNNDFGVLFRAQNTDTSKRLVYVDCITVTIYYEVVETDLSVNISLTNPNPYVDEYTEAKITVENHGEYIAHNTIIDLILPTGLEYVYHSNLHGIYDPDMKTWNLGMVQSNDLHELTILLRCTNTGTYTIQSNIQSDTTDPDETNNTDQYEFTVYPWLTQGTNYGFTYKGRHSSELGIRILDPPKRNIRPPTSDVLINVPGRDGEIGVQQDDKSNEIPLEFKVIAPTPEALREQLYEIGAWLWTDKVRNNVPVLESLIFDDETDKKYMGYFKGGINDDPKYNLAECKGTFLVPSGVAVNRVSRITGGSGVNEGSGPVPCKIYITASNQENMVITNTQTGQSITLLRGFIEGENVVIDTEKRIITANNRDIRVYGAFNNSFFKLKPGPFTITTTNGLVRRVEFDEKY